VSCPASRSEVLVREGPAGSLLAGEGAAAGGIERAAGQSSGDRLRRHPRAVLRFPGAVSDGRTDPGLIVRVHRGLRGPWLQLSGNF
jgi:hypothetical protein